MTSKTRLRAVQFHVLWHHYSTAGEKFPRSLIYNSDPELGYDEAESLYSKVRLDSLDEISPETVEMFRVLTRPEYRIAVRGHNAQLPDDDTTWVRVYSAWFGAVAVIAHQVPDTDLASGGDVFLWAVSTGAWIRELVELLPPAVKGKLPAVSDVAAQHPDSSRISSMRDEEAAATRAKFMAMKRSHGGRIVVTGGRPGEEKIVHTLHYLDRVDDGRYLATIGEYLDVEPADRDLLIRRLTNTLNETRKQLDRMRGDVDD
ncbi:MAG: ESX secretion-associated protein EspG [Nocardiaceae bacterium]|nr:ESX secretion-associated protein EspG [Nocardiaceae bacterium]